MEPDPGQEERTRLFQHLLHEEASFTQRNSYFLVAQSLMLVAYSTLSTDESAHRLVAIFGLALAGIWVYIGRSHLRYLRHVHQRCRDTVPDFDTTENSRPRRAISARWIIAHAIPSLSCLLWLLVFTVSLT